MTWEEKIVEWFPWRHRARVRRFIVALWPFVTRKRAASETAQKVTEAARSARRDAENELAAVREHMAPVIDKLIRVNVDVPQFVIRNMPPLDYSASTNAMPAFDEVPLRERRLNTRPTYRVQFDIATDLIEHAFIHGNDDIAIREVARRAAHVVERELKTINFRCVFRIPIKRAKV